MVEWACKYSLYQVQNALDEILRNFPARNLGQLLRVVVFPLGRRFRYPNDALGHAVATLLLAPSEARERLTGGIFICNDPKDPTGRVEYALQRVLEAEPVERRLREAGEVCPPHLENDAWLDDLLKRGVVEADEAQVLRDAYTATRAAIDVDDFPPDRAAEATAEEAA